MSNLNTRITKLENNRLGDDTPAGVVAIYNLSDPETVTVNGQVMTRAELQAKYPTANIFYIPDNGRG